LLPAFRKEECIEVASRYQLYPTSIAHVKQTPSHTFFRAMMGFSREKNDDPTLEEITIKNKENKYSDKFIELLSEYYLNL
jgi:tRNA1Val (adenine37-N6)-methyltransferase